MFKQNKNPNQSTFAAIFFHEKATKRTPKHKALYIIRVNKIRRFITLLWQS